MSTYWAVSSIGWGKGETADEAVENYVRIQLRNYPASTTVFKTRAKWEQALRDGEASADVWQSPEGVDGFVVDHRGLQWTTDGQVTAPAEIEQLVRLSGPRAARS